jgi:hypothetical protein
VTLGPNRPTDKVRATLLAEAYFEYHLGGCGAVDEPLEKDGAWLFRTKVGAAARPGPTILVDKRTGKTSAKGLPTVTDPSTYYRRPLDEPFWITHRTP